MNFGVNTILLTILILLQGCLKQNARVDRMLSFGAPSSSKNRQKLVQAGATFCRIHPDNLVEKARVISIAPGPSDIPHVRFAVSFERARFHLFDDGPRLLSLSSFAEFYRDPLPAGTPG